MSDVDEVQAAALAAAEKRASVSAAKAALDTASTAFIAAKFANDGKPAKVKAYRETKATMSAARGHFRKIRAANQTPVAAGDARVEPASIAATAAVNKVGS